MPRSQSILPTMGTQRFALASNKAVTMTAWGLQELSILQNPCSIHPVVASLISIFFWLLTRIGARLLWFQVPNTARISQTSKKPQNDIGNYLGLHIGQLYKVSPQWPLLGLESPSWPLNTYDFRDFLIPTPPSLTTLRRLESQQIGNTALTLGDAPSQGGPFQGPSTKEQTGLGPF